MEKWQVTPSGVGIETEKSPSFPVASVSKEGITPKERKRIAALIAAAPELLEALKLLLEEVRDMQKSADCQICADENVIETCQKAIAKAIQKAE